MIQGIGIDIVQISRVQGLVDQFEEAFALKILSSQEIQQYSDRLNDVRFLAKRFAAKEAVAKALGTGIGEQLSFKQITITKSDTGKPICTVDNVPGNQQILISISDEQEYVVAQAVALI